MSSIDASGKRNWRQSPMGLKSKCERREVCAGFARRCVGGILVPDAKVSNFESVSALVEVGQEESERAVSEEFG